MASSHALPLASALLALAPALAACGEAGSAQEPGAAGGEGAGSAAPRPAELEERPAAPASAGADSAEGAGRRSALAADLDAAHERMLAGGLHDALLGAARAAREELGKSRWLRVPGRGALKAHIVDYYLDWNAPRSRQGRLAGADLEAQGHPLRAIRAYSGALAERGVALLVVPVPNRLQVYPELLGVEPPAGFAGVDPALNRLLADLVAEGIEVVDLLPAFARERFSDAPGDDRELYLEFNHHWTPRGAALAARRIAAAARSILGAEPAGAQLPAPTLERGPWEVPVPKGLEEDFRPAEVAFRRVRAPDGAPAQLPDRASPVLLLGDSFSGYYAEEASDLASLLRCELGLPLDTIISPGGGVDAVWRSLARRESGLAGKRLVVWCFSAEALVYADKWEVVPLGDQ